MESLKAAKEAALAKIEEEKQKLYQPHYEDVDKQFSKLKSLGSINQPLIEDFAKSADYSRLIYDLTKLCSNLERDTEFLVLSKEFLVSNIGKKDDEKQTEQPDVVAFISKYDETKTLWVVSRGTTTVVDVLTDLAWLLDIKKIGGVPLPAIPLQRAEKCMTLLAPFIEKSDAKRIIFTGHSLGGAVSGCLFYMYNYVSMQQSSQLDSFLITISSPQLLVEVPQFMTSPDDSSKVDMTTLSTRVHNLVQRTDLVPRIVGPNKLPKFLYEMQGVGSKIVAFEKELLKRLKRGRDSFGCFGQYYALNPGHMTRKTFEVKHVSGTEVLNVFSSDLTFLALAVLLDHDSDTTAMSLIELCPSYKSKFIWESTRSIIGESYPFPEEYTKKVFVNEKEGRYADSNADEGKAMVKDSYVILGCCCCLQVLYSKFPQCIGCYGNQTCCCFAWEYKYCKYYENEPGKWCLCQQVKCDCIVPTTCCKAISQICCCDNRCAFPPGIDKDLPAICTICCFLTVCVNGRPEFKCCAQVGELLDPPKKEKIEKAEAVTAEEEDEDAPRLLKAI